MKSFRKYIENNHPLPWTIVKEHPNTSLMGNNSLVISYVRFKLIMDAVKKYFSFGDNVLDVGVYPGIMPQLFHEYYPGKDNYQNYYGVGLGFNEIFSNKMSEYGIKLMECDMEPRLGLQQGRESSVPLEEESINFAIFTDVVEHFYDPFYPLQEINRVLKFGSKLILTTDNLTRFGSLLALIRGKSCNVPLIEGNIFFSGDWRPHFREYSREELFQLMEWSGFEVLEHQYYEADFGQYRVEDCTLVKKDLRKLSPKRKLADEVRKLAKHVFPHFSDNHILVAKKVKSYKDMLAIAPKIATDMNEWLCQRKSFVSQ
jgi:SAM-dependent methyltransferase